MISLIQGVNAHVLSLAVDVVGWSCDRFADIAERTSAQLTEAADTARWVATATRCTP